MIVGYHLNATLPYWFNEMGGVSVSFRLKGGGERLGNDTLKDRGWVQANSAVNVLLIQLRFIHQLSKPPAVRLVILLIFPTATTGGLIFTCKMYNEPPLGQNG